MGISATIIIIVVTVLTSYNAWKNQRILEKWIFNPYLVYHHRQYGRFITSGFIHNDYMHLIFNMFTFFFFGTSIERVFSSEFGRGGIFLFVAFYLLAIVFSDIPSFIKHRNQHGYNSLGASGGVSAIVFSWILFFPTEFIYIMGIIPLPGFILGILFLLYSYYQGKRTGTLINHDAHLFGALFGILFTIAVIPEVITRFIREIASGFSFF